ncbi:MAG: hypothetical protein LAP87_11365 [Acidobacteriia bacterium]|nr:hypothetical protein [Terriglobia bacterium]
MLVRIRFGKTVKSQAKRRSKRRVALAAAGLLTPGAVLAAVLGLWRIAADLDWAGSFAIPSGPFSHWQTWMGTAVGLQAGARVLTRYGKRQDRAAERATPPVKRAAPVR